MEGAIMKENTTMLDIDWLLSGPPWSAYRTRLDLLKQPLDDLQVQAELQALLAHPQIQAIITELYDWPGPALQRHNDAKHALHKLVFLADVGLTINDPGITEITTKIMEHLSQDDIPQIKLNIPARFGGTGQDQWTWILCDFPSTLYALTKMGVKDERLENAANTLAGLVRENGWPCTAAPEVGKFRGPGRRDDPCPYANLISLKALAQFPALKDGPACHYGAESLLTLWEQRKERRPYIFAMGTGFARLKAPLIFYDLLHVLDVLTQFEWLYSDPRLQDMLNVLQAKADERGHFAPESVWQAWAGWDFGQKRESSPWITLLAQRIFSRVN
jgi:hypothetical protein